MDDTRSNSIYSHIFRWKRQNYNYHWMTAAPLVVKPQLSANVISTTLIPTGEIAPQIINVQIVAQVRRNVLAYLHHYKGVRISSLGENGATLSDRRYVEV